MKVVVKSDYIWKSLLVHIEGGDVLIKHPSQHHLELHVELSVMMTVGCICQDTGCNNGHHPACLCCFHDVGYSRHGNHRAHMHLHLDTTGGVVVDEEPHETQNHVLYLTTCL